MIPHATALQLAKHVERLLEPACAERMIVGSIRRRKDHVKDIELVVRSKPAAPTFGEPLSAKNALDVLLAKLVAHREWLLPEQSRRSDGPRHKRFYLPHAGGVEIELWICEADNFGNTVAIRTGDFDFSQKLVTQRRDGGLLPNGWMHEAGRLWPFRLAGDERKRFRPKAAPEPSIPCRTEADFFRHLGIFDVPSPQERDIWCAERLRGRLAAGKGVGV